MHVEPFPPPKGKCPLSKPEVSGATASDTALGHGVQVTFLSKMVCYALTFTYRKDLECLPCSERGREHG